MSLTRQQIEIKSQAARSEIVDQPGKDKGKPYRIGVIGLPSFYAATPGKEYGRNQKRHAKMSAVS